MRYAVVLLLIIIVAGTGCLKSNQGSSNCYVCTQVDSITSNIPSLDSIYRYTGVTCNLNPAQAKFYEKKNTFIDTVYLKNDTARFGHWTMKCDVDY